MKEVIERSKFKSRIYQYVAAFGANLGILSMGFHYGWPSAALPILFSGNYGFTLTEDKASWLVALIPMTSIIGDILAASIVNKLGRKKLILFASVPATISWILIAVADSETNLFVSRIIAGITDGLLFTVVPPYLAEISDPEIRGFLSGTFMSTLALGLLLENVMLYFFTISTAAYLSSIVTIIPLIILPSLPDSPYYFLINRQELKAKKSLRVFRRRYDVTEEIERITAGIEEDSGKTNLLEIFCNSTYRKCLLLSLLLTLTQHLSGILPIQSYAETLFMKTKNFLSPSISNIIYYLIFFSSVIVSLNLVDKVGRRPLVLFAASTAAVCLMANGIFLYIKIATNINTSSVDFLQLLFISVYTIAYCSGLHLLPVVVTTEIFPSNMKGLALCIVNIIFSFATTFCIKLFGWSMSFGMYVPFFLFTCCTVIGLILIAKYLPETKLKTMEELQIELRGSNKSFKK